MSNSNLPKVTVIIVARNSERYLKDAIESAIAQTYPNYDIILIDGQSTDATASIAKSYGQVRYVYQETLGLSQARNLGIELAQGDFIAFLDSDDRWTPNKLTLQAEVLRPNLQIQYVTAHLQLVADTETCLRNGYQSDVLATPKWGRTPGVLLARRELFTQVGAFNPELRIAGDLEWFGRVQQLEIPNLTLPDVLLYKRIRHDSLSAQSRANRLEVMKVLHRSIKKTADNA
jgi:glycosyltransferase involved in cell wall biosynthesis